MNKILWLLLLLAQMASGKILKATYEVSFGIFQTMGTAHTQLEIRDDQSYTIHVDAKTTGIAKLLSNNRVEVYESQGIVRNGRLIPDTFVKIRQTNSNKMVKTYTFDHPNKVVWTERTESKRGESNTEKERNDYYAEEDFLSLFFNLKSYSQGQQNYTFHAIGGNKKDGRIDAIFPKKEALAQIKKDLEMEEGSFLKVILNDRIFASANGELLINLDSEGLCEKAVLADVLLFGDIVGKRVR